VHKIDARQRKNSASSDRFIRKHIPSRISQGIGMEIDSFIKVDDDQLQNSMTDTTSQLLRYNEFI